MKIIDIFENREQNYYHVSKDPNLELSNKHKNKQSQMGDGFYITTDPLSWADTLYDEDNFENVYIYKVEGIEKNKILYQGIQINDPDFINWALNNGYMEKELIKRNGEIMYYIDSDVPMYDHKLTKKAEKLMRKDPMTGNTTNNLINYYLKDMGYIGTEAQYTPEGHQIVLYNTDNIELENLGTINDFKQNH